MPTVGMAVQTVLGKGVIREVRNSGRVLVDVGGRSVVFEASAVSVLDAPTARRAWKARMSESAADAPPPTRHSAQTAPVEIDLHGLTVEESATRVVDAINTALLADRAVVRFIHGRSGGRLRAALHRQLRAIPSVRGFRLDPRNEGVTVVDL